LSFLIVRCYHHFLSSLMICNKKDCFNIFGGIF
jgi:hypothetical protein